MVRDTSSIPTTVDGATAEMADTSTEAGTTAEMADTSITVGATVFMGLTRLCVMTAVAIRALIAYMVVSYRCGVGSRVPGGASTNSLLMVKVFEASNSYADSIGTPNALWNFSGDI